MRVAHIEYDVNVYNYNELSEEAKKKVKDWYLKGQEPCWFSDCCIERLGEIFPNSELEVEYSLNYCQGDGLNIYGSVNLNDLWNKIDKSKYTDKEKKFMEYVLKEYARDYTMKHNYRYCYCNSSSWNFTEDIIDDMEYTQQTGIDFLRKFYDVLEKFNKDCKEYMEKLCSDFESDGYAYFYEVDDEVLAEFCAANDYEFEKDGTVFYS